MKPCQSEGIAPIFTALVEYLKLLCSHSIYGEAAFDSFLADVVKTDGEYVLYADRWAERIALESRWCAFDLFPMPDYAARTGEIFKALAEYIELLLKKSMFYSSPDYDGPANFLKHVRMVEGNLIVCWDGWGQRLDLESQWRTLSRFRYDPWPILPETEAAA